MALLAALVLVGAPVLLAIVFGAAAMNLTAHALRRRAGSRRPRCGSGGGCGDTHRAEAGRIGVAGFEPADPLDPKSSALPG